MILQKIIDIWKSIGTDPQRLVVAITIILVLAYSIYNGSKKRTKEQARNDELKLIWHSIYFNISIIILMILLFPFENKVAWVTLELIWYLSFTWICARISSYEN